MNFLPIFQERDRILSCVLKNQVTVFCAPTGSGKTTGLPIILNESGQFSGLIGITQPRRIACVSISDYLNKISNEDISSYKIRFSDTTYKNTKIKIMTDGILLQETKLDKDLLDYSVIMIDEAHDRTLNIDFILGLLKNLIKRRSDLKVIISSATINTKVFSDYFDGAPVVQIDGTSYPVEVVYNPVEYTGPNSIKNIISKIFEIVSEVVSNKVGDILIFLHGEKAIKDCISALETLPDVFIVPLYARLSKENQDRVFLKAPDGKIKIVVSTNIAETSITIDSIRVVIDSGIVKINYYNHKSFTSVLKDTSISKSSADQRKGRAGRTQEGICYRLYSEEDYQNKDPYTLEEIYRTDLSEVILRITELGINDIHSFDFISKPKPEELNHAISSIKNIKALDKENNLTDIGKMMIRFPLLPRHSRMIVEAMLRYPDVIEDVVILIGFISNPSPFLLPQGQESVAREKHDHFSSKEGDFYSFLKIYDGFLNSQDRAEFCKKYYLDIAILLEIENVILQLCDIVSSDFHMPVMSNRENKKSFTLAIAAGVPDYICAKDGRVIYKNKQVKDISIHPSSFLFSSKFPDFILVSEIVRTTRLFARGVTKIEKEWVLEFDSKLYKELVKPTKHSSEFFKEKKEQKKDDNLIKIISNKVTIFGKKFELDGKVIRLSIKDYNDFYDYYAAEKRLFKFQKNIVAKVMLSGQTCLKTKDFFSLYFFAKYFRPFKYKSINLDSTNFKLDILSEEHELKNAFLKIGLFGSFKKHNGIVTLFTNEKEFWFEITYNIYIFLENSLYSLSLIEDIFQEKGKTSYSLQAALKRIENLEKRLNNK